MTISKPFRSRVLQDLALFMLTRGASRPDTRGICDLSTGGDVIMRALRLFMLFAITLFTTSAVAHSTLSDITDEGAEKVTLPVIGQSKLLIHDTSGIDVSTPDGPVQSLPVAVFLTRKSPDEVVAWYRETLPDYTVLSGEGGRHIQILERVGEDTRIDSPDTYRTPNVRIRPTDARTATHMEGARTMLQIYYAPAEAPEGPADEDS